MNPEGASRIRIHNYDYTKIIMQRPIPYVGRQHKPKAYVKLIPGADTMYIDPVTIKQIITNH